MKYPKIVAAAALGLSLVALPTMSHAESESENDTPIKGSVAVNKETPESSYATLAKASITDAIQTGSAKQSGTIIKAELLADDGYLVWEVEIVDKKGETWEVVIDAGNGKVLAVEADHPDNDHADADRHEESDND